MVRAYETNDASGLENMGQEQVLKLGKIAYEGLKAKGVDIKESLKAKTATEDLDIGDSQLFTTAISTFIEKKLRPKLVAESVIRSIPFDTRGKDSIKIPVRNTLISASDLPDDGAVSYDSGTYASTTVTLRYSYAANTISHELASVANVDLLAEELGEIGDAIARKVDSDIISAFQSATTAGNGNLTKLGATATVSFDNLVDGQASAAANYAEPDVILLNHSTLAAITKLDEMTGGNSTTGALAYQGENGTVMPVMRNVLGMRVVASQQVDADDIYLIDTARTGYLIRSNRGVETFDGRRSGYLAYEVIGAHQYGIGIVQPKAIFRLEENAA